MHDGGRAIAGDISVSNVLIGIIGVILFIGLALAGALFLGPRFQDASNSSRASSVSSGMAQISSAITMKQTSEGVTVNADDPTALMSSLKSDGYLKEIPRNMVTGGVPGIVNEAGSIAPSPVKWVYMDLGPSAASKEVCRSIEKTSGSSDFTHLDTKMKFDEWAPAHRRLGCFFNFYSNSYLAYNPV